MTYRDLAEEWETGDSLECITSGSTGKPKKLNISKKNLLESAKRTADFFNLSSSSLLYSCISPNFIGGKMMFVRQQFLGCSLKWETPSNRPLEGITDTISLLSVVPSQMLYILDNLDKMPIIENILIGGSSIPLLLRTRIAESGLNAFESYGMTETASHIALRKIEPVIKPFHTLGDIRVEDKDGALKIIIPDWQTLITNDCAEILSPREFFITGRKDNIIISGGRKINPEMIEEKLSSYIENHFIVTSVPDIKWGQKIVLVIESQEKSFDPQPIMTYCKESLENYEKPKEIFVTNHLPRTDSGKIIRSFPDLAQLIRIPV